MEVLSPRQDPFDLLSGDGVILATGGGLQYCSCWMNSSHAGLGTLHPLLVCMGNGNGKAESSSEEDSDEEEPAAKPVVNGKAAAKPAAKEESSEEESSEEEEGC